MNIQDPSGCLTDERVPLISLEELVAEYRGKIHPEPIVRIKHANLYLVDDQQPAPIDLKTRSYFRRLQQAGILGRSRLTEQTLIHEVKGQVSKLVGVEMPDGRTYYLHIMSSDKVVNQALQVLEEMPGKPISTLTGICMFGSGVDTAVTCDGNTLPVSEVGGLLPEIPDRRIEDIVIRHRISLYETYKIMYFSAFLNALKFSCRRPYDEAYLMTPDEQYPLYLVPAFVEGKISREIFRKWAGKTSARARSLFRLFAERVRVPMTLLPSPLQGIAGYVDSSIAHDRAPSLERALEILGNEDSKWAVILSEKDNIPVNWRELILLSYVRGVIEAATDAAAKGNLLVTADDLSEKPMANAYAKVRRKLKRQDVELPRVLGLYSPSAMVAADPDKNSYLYGHRNPSGREFRAVIRTYRHTGKCPDGADVSAT
jgi:hypothetical protein